MNIGIFGGSFNPLHYGHIYIATCFLHQCNLDKCIFIPANISPFKQYDRNNIFAPEQRLKMVEEVIKKTDNKFEICDYEIKQSGVSYTYDTLCFLKQKYCSEKLFLLIGTDQAIEFHKWKNYKKILNMVQIVIARRVGSCSKRDKQLIKETVFPHNIVWLKNNLIPISSTELRMNDVNLL